MVSFDFTVQEENGIHARPAGILVTQAKTMPCRITIGCKGRQADAKRLISVMGLGAKRGDVLSFVLEGEDEENCKKHLEAFCRENL